MRLRGYFYASLSIAFALIAIAGSYYSICLFVQSAIGFSFSVESLTCALISLRLGHLLLKELYKTLPEIPKREVQLNDIAYIDGLHF